MNNQIVVYVISGLQWCAIEIFSGSQFMCTVLQCSSDDCNVSCLHGALLLGCRGSGEMRVSLCMCLMSAWCSAALVVCREEGAGSCGTTAVLWTHVWAGR